MYRGVLYMLLASFSFALVNFLVKILSDRHDLFPEIQNYPEIELVFFRSIISLTICFAIIKARKIPFFGVNKKWLVIRGFAGFVSLTLFFYTIANIPLAIATIIQYLSPIIIVTISRTLWTQFSGYFSISTAGQWL